MNVCSDMSCHLRGADDLKASLQQRFHGMSEKDVAVRDVSCLGQCDGAPAVSINDHIYRSVTTAQAEALVLHRARWQRTSRNAADEKNVRLASDPYAVANITGRYGDWLRRAIGTA